MPRTGTRPRTALGQIPQDSTSDSSRAEQPGQGTPQAQGKHPRSSTKGRWTRRYSALPTGTAHWNSASAATARCPFRQETPHGLPSSRGHAPGCARTDPAVPIDYATFVSRPALSYASGRRALAAPAWRQATTIPRTDTKAGIPPIRGTATPAEVTTVPPMHSSWAPPKEGTNPQSGGGHVSPGRPIGRSGPPPPKGGTVPV